MPSYVDEYRSSTSSRHGGTSSSSSHRHYDDRPVNSESRRRASPDIWRPSNVDSYETDERRPSSRQEFSSSGRYAHHDYRDVNDRRSRHSGDYHDRYRARDSDDGRSRLRSPPRSSRDHDDRTYSNSSRDRKYETDRHRASEDGDGKHDVDRYRTTEDRDRKYDDDRRRMSDDKGRRYGSDRDNGQGYHRDGHYERDKGSRYESEKERRYENENDRTYENDRVRYHQSDRPRRPSMESDMSRHDRRRYNEAARSHSRERQSDHSALSIHRSSRDNDSSERQVDAILLKRKQMPLSTQAQPHKVDGSPRDEDDKLEMMMNSSKHINGTNSKPVDPAVSTETSRWKKINNDSSSREADKGTTLPANGQSVHEKGSHPSDISITTTDVVLASRNTKLSFGRLALPHELSLDVRQTNKLAVAPYHEGVKIVLKTAREKGVVDLKPKDPRPGSKKPNRLLRTALHPVRFVWDRNSVGKKPPPPPRTVVLTNLSALTKVGMLLNRFRTFGRVQAHKLEMDPKIGQSLGICSVTFAHDFDEHNKVLSNVASNVVPQNGVKVAKLAYQALNGTTIDQVKVTALLDREGETLKEQIKSKLAANAAKLRPITTATAKTAAGITSNDAIASSPLDSPSAAARGSGTPAPKHSMAPPELPRSSRPSSTTYSTSRPSRFDSSPSAARSALRYDDNARRSTLTRDGRDDDRRYSRSVYDRNVASPLSARRSDDYDRRRPSYANLRDDTEMTSDTQDKEDTRAIMDRLTRLKHPYVFIAQPRSSDIVTSDIRDAMSQVQPAWVRQGDSGWYVAFDDRNGAHGCKIVTETLTVRGYRLSVEVRYPTETDSYRDVGAKPATNPALLPSKLAPKSVTSAYDTGITAVSKDELQKSSWTEAELQDAVFRMVQKDLADVFVRDVKSRIVNPHITQYLKPNNEGGRILARASVKSALSLSATASANAPGFDAKSSLPSFRKLVSATPTARVESIKSVKAEAAAKTSRKKLGSKLLEPDEHDGKRTSQAKGSSGALRKGAARLDWTDDESDMDEDSTEQESGSRSVSASVEPPSTDGTSVQDVEELALHKGKKGKATVVKKGAKQSKAAAPARKPKAPPKVKAPPKLDPFEAGLVEDAEDLVYLKIALQRLQLDQPLSEDTWVDEELERQIAEEDAGGPGKHETDSARTEGYYVIPAAQKAIHLPDRNKATDKEEEAHVLQSARNNRADSRRLVLGFEQHKRETATDTDMFKFNQLRTRKKQLKFAKSPIHDWGLYAMELIPAGDMVIEYVGEMVRQQVADEREKQYERQGNFSTYLFRVDDDLVVDATHKGNIARLMNHCCTPNCNAKILTLNGEKRIVLFAKDPIRAGEELTYDYKFQSSGDDEDAIACLCGSPGCRRFL